MGKAYMANFYVTREYIRKHRDTYFVFGDNILGIGYGGQARECRGEPNTIGIPTKWSPSMKPQAFFRDADFYKVKPYIDEAFRKMIDVLEQGYDVCFLPNIGRGLAKLHITAPVIMDYINNWIQEILREYGKV